MNAMVSRCRRSRRLVIPGIALALLAGCGSKPQGPVEQVIVNGPVAANTVPNRATPAATGIDLAATGVKAAATCLVCHAVKAGAPSTIGPNLHGIVGRKAGSLAGFTYSGAMRASGLTWTVAELDAFIAKPAGKVPGTTMAFGGVQDAATRKAIIAYISAQ